MALSNLFRFSNFFNESFCSILLFTEIKVNFDDDELLQFLCILLFTLYEKYINQFNDISLSLK